MWKVFAKIRGPQAPQVPANTRLYAIGDIHGRADLLQDILDQIDADVARRPIARDVSIFLGDYVDRGPASRQVIDLLLEWQKTHEAVFLKGNHEALLLRFLENASVLDDWRHYGGLETLTSYGLTPSLSPSVMQQFELQKALASNMPEAHRTFLEHLNLYHVCGDYAFVHAGIKPGKPMELQTESDLLWIREEFLAWDAPFDKKIVHGHTPVLDADVRNNRVNIDTGAYATGRLTCMAFEGTSYAKISR